MIDHQLSERLDRIEDALRRLLQERTVQPYYSTADVARMLGKAEFTVREWCRMGRVKAQKRACGRGNTQEWMISHEEMERLRSEGLLPLSQNSIEH
jgi:hypothetical protein